MKKNVLRSFLITFKKCYKMKTAVRLLSAVVLSLLLNSTMNAQSTIVKLPTTDSTSSFNITQSNDTKILRMSGDGGFYVDGTFGTGAIPIEGAGVRLMWYPKKAAFRAGSASGTNWDDVNSGNFSVAMGNSPEASGDNSVALGYVTIASGVEATALGRTTTASGGWSTAMGFNTTASGYGSLSAGYQTTASGNYSTALGTYVSTNGYTGAFIIGDNSTAVATNNSANNQMIMRFASGYSLFTNSAATVGVQLAASGNSWSTVSDSTKKFAFLPIDGKSILEKISKFDLRTWSYKGQDPRNFRHYGPMAQEFFNAFGHDKYGVIGNDTTISQADFEGVLLVAVQALEKNNNKLKDKVTQLQKEIDELNKMKTEFAEFKKDMSSFINKGNITKKELTLNSSQR